MSDSILPEASIRESYESSDQDPQSLSPQPFTLDDLTAKADSPLPKSDQVFSDVELDLRIDLGRTRMRLEDVLQLRAGSVVALDNAANDPVDVYVNNRLIARGEILVMNDRFCVRVTELVGS